MASQKSLTKFGHQYFVRSRVHISHNARGLCIVYGCIMLSKEDVALGYSRVCTSYFTHNLAILCTYNRLEAQVPRGGCGANLPEVRSICSTYKRRSSTSLKLFWILVLRANKDIIILNQLVLSCRRLQMWKYSRVLYVVTR